MGERSVPGNESIDDSWHEYELTAAESPVEGVVQAAAAVTNTPPADLDPLVRSIDPDALEALVSPKATDASKVKIRFRYAGCDILLTNPHIWIRERE